MKKVIKNTLVITFIAGLIILNYIQFQRIKNFYSIVEDNETKSTATFWYLLNGENKGIRAAAVLEDLSNVSDSHNRNEVIDLLSKAKIQLEEWEWQITHLIHQADDYDINPKRMHGLNSYRTASEKQKDMMIDLFLNQYENILSISKYYYNNNEDFTLSKDTKIVFKEMAVEINKINNSIESMRKRYYGKWDFPKSGDVMKRDFISSIEEPLNKIHSITTKHYDELKEE